MNRFMQYLGYTIAMIGGLSVLFPEQAKLVAATLLIFVGQVDMKRRSIENTPGNRSTLDELGIDYSVGNMKLRLYFYITNGDLVALKDLIVNVQVNE